MSKGTLLDMSNHVTVRELAKRSGWSKSTVAMALKNDPRVSEKTRSAIRKLAETSGYKTDPAVQRFVSLRWPGKPVNRGFSFGLLMERRLLWEDWQVSMVSQLKRQSDRLGYGFDVFALDTYEGMERALSVLEARNTQGMMIGPFENEAPLRDLPFGKIAAVNLGRFTGLDCPTVNINTTQKLRLALEWSRRSGRSPVGISCLYGGDSERSQQAEAALQYYTRKHWLSSSVKRYEGPLDHRESFMKWFAKERPRLLLGHSKRQYEWLVSSGVKVPEDCAFIAFHKGRDSGALAGLLDNSQKVARMAAMVLDQQVRGRMSARHFSGSHVVIDSKWSPGGSFAL